MEQWNKFLSILKNTVVIIDGFENLDDTSIQTLELYFDKFKNVVPNFVFLTSSDNAVHQKLKCLLRTNLYSEYTLLPSSMDSCLETIKFDATDFIQSFYFEKIKENYGGSYLYFVNAIEYLKESGVLVEFDNKLLIKNKKSVILPKDLQSLCKARMKNLSKTPEISFILAYSSILGSVLDLKTLSALGVKNVEKNAEILEKASLAILNQDKLVINNFRLVEPIITASLKKEAEDFLVKNVIANLGKGLEDSTMALIMGRLGMFKEEYLTLWKNSQFAMSTGDYDSYLKNCLGFLSLVEHIESNISKDEIESNKKDVYNNILMSLYSYSPTKIYFIETLLLMDAMKDEDNDRIVKLSNLMLQGALISSNYGDALGLLHNILSRMENPELVVNGEVNTKFLLLSLVNIEILYNIGEYRQCVDISEQLLSVLSTNMLEKVKPASFSLNLFVTHLLDTFRLTGFAKLFLMDSDLDQFYVKVRDVLQVDLPERDAIDAIQKTLSGEVYSMGNVEEYDSFSKVIFLILQEFSILEGDYKRFAQNIYQAKLLASELNQAELSMFCELLIAYSYSRSGIVKKAMAIYADIIEKAEKSAMFSIYLLAQYFVAKLKQNESPEDALLIINDSLAKLRKKDNQAQILYGLYEDLYIKILKKSETTVVDLDLELKNLDDVRDRLAAILK